MRDLRLTIPVAAASLVAFLVGPTGPAATLQPPPPLRGEPASSEQPPAAPSAPATDPAATVGAVSLRTEGAATVAPAASPAPRSAGPSPDPRACGWERVLPLDPVAGPLHLGTKTYPSTLDLGAREVVLTFDDGPSPETTPAVLRALSDACVHATFFLIGRNAAANPRLARREVDEGHSVGHHSNTHPSFTLRGFDTGSAEQDIRAGIEADEGAIFGAAAQPADHPHTPFFRFPGFADTPALLNRLDARHVAVFGADLWAADWRPMTPEHERERVLALLEQRPLHNGIILFHDTKRETAAMLPGLLRALRRRGYTIVHLVYAPGAPLPALTNPRPGPSATERIIARLHPPIVVGAHHLAGREPPRF